MLGKQKVVTTVNFPTLKKDGTNLHNVNKCYVFSNFKKCIHVEKFPTDQHSATPVPFQTVTGEAELEACTVTMQR